MTDGCGWINKAGLRRIHYQFQWSTWPTAIQCRVAGAKVSHNSFRYFLLTIIYLLGAVDRVFCFNILTTTTTNLAYG